MKPEESSQSLVAEGKRRSVITWQGHVISSLQCVFDIYIYLVCFRPHDWFHWDSFVSCVSM